jgi:hypothetical protein
MANLDRLRQLTLDAMAPALGGSVAAFRRTMETAIARAHTAAYVAATAERTGVSAAAVKGLSRAERTELQARIAEQHRYLDGFVSDLKAGRLTPAQAQARAALYAGPARGTYYEARYPGLSAYPCDGGTPCLGNCRCHLEERDGGIWWVLSAAEHCAGCVDRAAGSPYHAGK